MKECIIEKIGFSYEVKEWGLIMLDGCPDHMWKTVGRFDDLDDAIESVDKNRFDTIEIHGDNWDIFHKCEFCNEWFPESDLNAENLCFYCKQAIESHC